MNVSVPSPLEKAKDLLFVALWVDVVLTAVILMSDLWVLGRIGDMRNGLRISSARADTIGMFGKLSWAAVATTIFVGISLLRWLAECYREAARQGMTGSNRKNGRQRAGCFLS